MMPNGNTEGGLAWNVHVIPDDDTRDGFLYVHFASAECPCHPLQAAPDELRWVHNAFDARERWERQDVPTGLNWSLVRELLPPEEDGNRLEPQMDKNRLK